MKQARNHVTPGRAASRRWESRARQESRESTVAIVGCGALGTVQAEMLTRAGVGTLHLIDRDFVEWSNLQRQFLFDEADAADATPKAIAAAKRLKRSILR